MKRNFCIFLSLTAVCLLFLFPVRAVGRSVDACLPCRTIPQRTPPHRSDNSIITDMDTAPQEQPVRSGSMSMLETEACRLINIYRNRNGLPSLTVSADLSQYARIKSADMLNNRYFQHNSPTYGSPFTMMRSMGIRFTSAGENIASGYHTAQTVVNAWLASPAHRANILSTSYSTVGIGHTGGYWTMWLIR